MVFPDRPYIKRVYRNEYASVHWSAVKHEERFSYSGFTAAQTWVLFFRRFEVRIEMFALPKKGSRHFSRIAGEQKRGFVSWLDRPNGVRSFPGSAQPRRPAVHGPDQSGPLCVWLLDSTRTETKKRRPNGQQQGKKTYLVPLINRRCSGDELRGNCESIWVFVFVCAFWGLSGDVFSTL